MKNYERPFKERALELYYETKSYKAVTEAFKISKGVLYNWIHEGIRAHGNIGNKNAQKLDEEAFIKYVDENPNATLQELGNKFGVARSTAGEALKRLGYTYKKTNIYKEANRAKRRLFKKRIRKIAKRRRVYVDESGINKHLYQTHGWSRCGKRIVERVSGMWFKRTNLIADYWRNNILAQTTFTESCTAYFFENWFTTTLLPVVPTDAVIIMDNARFHRKSALATLLQSYNTTHHTTIELLYLPPYSPDYNPIEHYWANLKQRIGKTKDNFPSLLDSVEFNFV